MEETNSFVPLLVVVVLAFLVPLALARFRRLRLPVVVGEILAGILVGDSGLGWVHPDAILEVLSLLGFAYLMFLAGLEVDFGAVIPQSGAWGGSRRERLTQPLSLGLLAFGLTLGPALLAGWGLQRLDAADSPWLMALILSTTSLGLVMPVLKERGLMNRPYGQVLLVAAVIADFATMLLVSIYVVVVTEGLSPDILLVLLLFGAFGTAYSMLQFARRRLPAPGILKGLSQATAQIDVRGAFAIGLLFIALAQGLGVEMILGAFLGGALISLLAGRGGAELRHKLDVFGYAFFIPIFFIMVGVRFDLTALLSSTQSLLLLPVLVILAYGIKLVAALPFRLRFSPRQTLAAGGLLASHLSLTIAVSAIGLELGSIDTATNSAIILLAIFTSTLSPLMFNRLVPAATAGPRTFVIVGAGRSARLLARRIAGHGHDLVVLDSDPDRLSRAREMNLPVLAADPADPAAWEAWGPGSIQAVAVLLPEDAQNLAVCRLVRERLPTRAAGPGAIERVISRVHDATQAVPFAELGVQVINPSLSPVVELEYLLLYPSVSSLIADLEDEHDIVEVQLGCRDLVDRPIRDLELPLGAIIVLVRRNGDVIYPRGDTVLQIGDQLTLMGSLDAVRDLVRRCE